MSKLKNSTAHWPRASSRPGLVSQYGRVEWADCSAAAVLQAQPPTARSPNLPSWKALYNTQAELQDYHSVAVPFRLIFNNFVKESLQVDILTVGMLPYPICRVDHHRVPPGQVELQQCSIHPIQFADIFAEFRRIRNLFTNQYLEVFKFFLNS